jgi:hypothetical protein
MNMAATFLDTQDESNPNNGLSITTGTQLAGLISRLRDREPFFFMLKGQRSRTLLVGLARSIGCVQFTDDRAESTMAVSPDFPTDAEFIEFLTANTATPVPARFCMPLRLVSQIAAHFVENNEPSDAVLWEPI